MAILRTAPAILITSLLSPLTLANPTIQQCTEILQPTARGECYDQMSRALKLQPDQLLDAAWKGAYSKDGATVYNSRWDGSVRAVEKYLDKVLLDPDSFDAISWGPVITNGKEYRVALSYRAKNSFGGYVIKTMAYRISADGHVIDSKEYDGGDLRTFF